MKHVRRAALMLVLAMPGIAAAQERALAGGVGYGGPLGAAVTGELLYGLKADLREEGDRFLGPLFRVGGAGGPAVLFALGLGVRF